MSDHADTSKPLMHKWPGCMPIEATEATTGANREISVHVHTCSDCLRMQRWRQITGYAHRYASRAGRASEQVGIPNVQYTVAVASGKGGVGKSTTAGAPLQTRRSKNIIPFQLDLATYMRTLAYRSTYAEHH